MSVPASLADPDLAELWSAVAARLEGRGEHNRGRLKVPPLTSRAQLALGSLLDRKLGVTIDLGALEQALVRLDVGGDLVEALAALGAPVSNEPAARRVARDAARAARDAVRARAATWPEPWAPQWIDGVVKAGLVRGLDVAEACRLVDSVRSVLSGLPNVSVGLGDGLGDRRAVAVGDALGDGFDDGSGDALAVEPVSRVDLAARTLGSSHALDAGTRVEAATVRALSFILDAAPSRELWERAGAHVDLVSGAALAWALPVCDSPLGEIVQRATGLGLPIHLTQLALRNYPVKVPDGSTILVAENPRVVEAAAQGAIDIPVISTNGNPSGAVRLLLRQLVGAGATLRYHGDFDAAGLAMCARLVYVGLVPWKMGADDYAAALAEADAQGVALPVDERPAGATDWDPGLQAAFNADRRIVHEERLLPGLLSG